MASACFQMSLKKRLNFLKIKNHLPLWVMVMTCKHSCPLNKQKTLTTSGQTTNSQFSKFPLGRNSVSRVQITYILDKVPSNKIVF